MSGQAMEEILETEPSASDRLPGIDQKPTYRRPLSLPEQIAAQVSEAILAGVYRPGDPVREHDLAENFGVSRGPIREALRLLEKDGVVQIVPNRGARVTRLTSAEVRDIFEVRAALTAVAVVHFCQSGTAEDRAVFHAGIDRLQTLAKDPAAQAEYVKQSAALARLIASTSHNERLKDMLLSLALQTMRYTQLGLLTAERRLASALIWQKAGAALEAGDPDRAAFHVRRLIMDSRDAAAAALENDPSRE